MFRVERLLRLALVLCFCLPRAGISFAANISTHTPAKSKSQKISETQHTRRRLHHLAQNRPTVAPHSVAAHHAVQGTAHASVRPVSIRTPRHRYYERFTMSSFAEDLTAGDNTAGEDPVVRQAAIDALGNMNGTVVAIEPTSGRILAMVNQKLALSSGAQPCSTIKLSVALSALSEGLITKETPVSLGGQYRMSLTQALTSPANNLGLIQTKLFPPSWVASAKCARSAKAFP
jgi:membrane carboxypeptidase/penicillin-binding protein